MYREREDSLDEQGGYMRSPGQMQNDSLEREDSSVVPVPVGGEYQLTFKKNQHGLFFSHEKEEPSMMSGTERELVSQIQQPIAYYESLPLDTLSTLPFADLYSLQLPLRQKAKLSLIGQLLQHKRLYLKSRSVSLNYRCLSLNDSPTHQDKNRLFILELLEKQLNKKCFIQALKINYLKGKYVTLYGEEKRDWNPQKVDSRKLNEQLFGDEEQEEVEQERQWKKADKQWYHEQEGEQAKDDSLEGDSNNEGQVLIFIQVVSAIAKKLLFSAFKTILNESKNRHRSVRNTASDLSPISTNKRQVRINSPQQVLSNQYIHHQTEHEQQHFPETNYVPSYNQEQSQSQLEMNEVSQDPHLQNYTQRQAEQEDQEGDYQYQEGNQLEGKLNELYSYIEELHDEAAQTDSILRRFFLRWKISLLEAIADSMIQQLRGEQEQSHSQVEEHLMQHRRLTSEEGSQQGEVSPNEEEVEVMDNYWSRNTTELSQVDSNLKHQKYLLKSYLHQNELKLFFRNLSYYHENTMIKSICRKVYRAKLMSKAFQAIKTYCQQEQRMRDMEGYCQEMAQCQEEDQTTAFYFWKTNLLHKYFKGIKENRRDMKMERILSSVTAKLAFRTLKKYSYQGKKSHETLERFKVYRESKILFKYFTMWKQQHRSQNKQYERLKSYKLFKNQELKSHIFSILKLGFKKMLVKEVRAQKHHSLVTKDKILQHLKLMALEGCEFRYKQESLKEYLQYRRGKDILTNFIAYYQQYRQHQMLVVREEKIRRTLLGLHALKGIKNWRRRHMKKTIYETVEEKLKRLNQKQKKKEIFHFWLRRTFDQSRRGSPTHEDRHKKWLVNYYSGLCSVMPD